MASNEQIAKLQKVADENRYLALVRVCRIALGLEEPTAVWSREAAMAECERVIEDAQGQLD